jgi:hypothetical protein
MVLKGAGPMGAMLANTITVAAANGGSSVSYEASFEGGGIAGPMGDMVAQAAGKELATSLDKLRALSA